MSISTKDPENQVVPEESDDEGPRTWWDENGATIFAAVFFALVAAVILIQVITD